MGARSERLRRNQSMNDVMPVFVIVAAVAIVIQMGILVALYFAFKKTSARIETLASRVETVTAEVQTRVLPTIDNVQALVASTRPQIEAIVENLSATTTTVRGQVERLESTLDDIVDRTRLQVIRADELVTRTMDRVEETTAVVQRTVVSPVRVASGFMQGLGVGLGAFFRRRRSRDGASHEEMFI
jgi:methyl-accepting chemotaxis protein